MSKWYEVNVTICKTYAIEVPDDATLETLDKDEIDYLFEELDMAQAMDDAANQTDVDYVEIKGEVEIDRLKRHATEVIEIYQRS
jgi:benzoyl-CoA reductase/2-hydroxyglutaryl-CoA dehydratase subunit BcrC/BadD/HgdB